MRGGVFATVARCMFYLGATIVLGILAFAYVYYT